MCLTVNAYKLDTNDDFEKMSPYEEKNIFVDKRGTELKPQKQQNIDILIVIATTYLLHREISGYQSIVVTLAKPKSRGINNMRIKQQYFPL